MKGLNPGVIIFISRLSLIVRVNVVLNRTQVLLTLKMTTAQVVETSVTVDNNSPIEDYFHPEDKTQPTYTHSVMFLFELSGSLSMPVISSAPCYYKPNSFLKIC